MAHNNTGYVNAASATAAMVAPIQGAISEVHDALSSLDVVICRTKDKFATVCKPDFPTPEGKCGQAGAPVPISSDVLTHLNDIHAKVRILANELNRLNDRAEC